MMTHADRIGGYDILRVMGHGAHSTIFAAQDPHDDQIYALKHVVRKTAEDQRFLQQAINEYQIAGRLNHPNIRRYYKLKRYRRFVTVNEIVLLMELVEGRNLVQQRPDSLYELIQIFIKVCDALEEIHRHGFIHGDMKPNNILISDDNEVKIIDFGQSCAIDTVKTRIQGTPDYIAPEQVKRRPLTARTDIFNLGASLYWCVTDHHIPTLIPRTDIQVGLRQARRLKQPSDYNPDLPMSLNNLILNCLRTRPHNRPMDITEVRSRLQIVAAKLDREQPSRQMQRVDYDEDDEDAGGFLS